MPKMRRAVTSCGTTPISYMTCIQSSTSTTQVLRAGNTAAAPCGVAPSSEGYRPHFQFGPFFRLLLADQHHEAVHHAATGG